MDIDISKPIVLALGGNAISKGSGETVSEQFVRAKTSLASIVDLAKAGYKIALTHGNGPQVGNALRRVELSEKQVIALPLYLCGATTQGEIGYIMANTLVNLFAEKGVDRPVSAIVTQVVVDKSDAAFKAPTKFIGRFYTKEEAEILGKKANWILKEDSGRGWRRVVPSPWPKEIVEIDTIRKLLENDSIVICTGGGGNSCLSRR